MIIDDNSNDIDNNIDDDPCLYSTISRLSYSTLSALYILPSHGPLHISSLYISFVTELQLIQRSGYTFILLYSPARYELYMYTM